MIASVHTALIVEDDPATALLLAGYVRSLGHEVRIAATLAEVDQAIRDGGFCYVLLDKQIPAVEAAVAVVATGDLAQKRLRASDPRRHPKIDAHLLPILVITGFSQSTPFIVKNLRDGACDFIPKPCDAETVTRAILDALERARREEHAECAALTVPPAPEVNAVASQPLVRIVLDGLPIEKRISFRVNRKRCDLQPERFAVLLRLSAPRARASESYLSVSDLGLRSRPEIPSRIHEAVAHAVPEGFLIIQKGEQGMRRLHPLVAVEPIDWAIFERHENAAITRIAAVERKLR